MNSHLKFSLLLTVAGCFVAMSASAKVTPITQYLGKGTLTESESGGTSCYKKGLYEPEDNIPGATCEEVRIIGNKECKKCHCDTEKYPFTQNDCSTEGFTPPSQTVTANIGCHLYEIEKDNNKLDKNDGARYYNTCACNGYKGYYVLSDFHYDAQALATKTGDSHPFKTTTIPEKKVTATYDSKTVNRVIKCYNAKAYTCKDGSAKDYTKETKGQITITYAAPDLLTKGSGVGNFKCTSYVSGISGGSVLYPNKGSAVPCMKISTGTTTYHNTTYYYYDKTTGTAGCDTGTTNCFATEPTTDCIAYATKTAKDYQGNALTCYQLTGCKTDGNCYGQGAISIGSLQETSGITYVNYSTPNQGNYTCLKVTGCKSPTSNVSNSSTTVSAFQTAVNNAGQIVSGATYDAGGMYGMTSSTTIRGYICKYATGCDTTNKYYDVTAGTDTEWLKYFVQ